MTSIPVTNTNPSTFNIDQNLSINIPYVEKKYATFKYISKIFKSLNLADVERVDFVKHHTYDYLTAFIHMSYWYENITVKHLQEKILCDSNVKAKIVHSDPKFWILRKNLNPIQKDDSHDSINSNDINSDLTKFKLIMYDNIDTIMESNKELFNLVDSLKKIIYNQQEIIDDKQKQLKNIQWYINLHEANIKYLCEKVNLLEQSNHTPHKRRHICNDDNCDN